MTTSLPIKKKRYSKSYLFGVIIIAFFVVVAILAPWITPHDPYERGFKNSDLPPMWVHNPYAQGVPDHPLGTDRLGRDIYSRYVYGIRTALLLIAGAIPITVLLGTLIGMISGFYGRRIDQVLLTIMDVIQSLPGIMFSVIIILILRYLFPPSWINGVLIIVIGFSAISWTGLARMIRAEVLRLKSLLFFEAAISLGASNWRIITKHLFPNIAHLVLVWIINNIPAVVLLEAILGYIGVSITNAVTDNDFTVISWGGLFYAGRSTLSSNPMTLLFPAASLLLLSMSFILIGDHIKRRFQD